MPTQSKQPNSNERKCSTCQESQCRHAKKTPPKAAPDDDLCAQIAAEAEQAALDMVEASLLAQNIEQAMLFRVWAHRQPRRFFNVFEQFSQN